VGDEKPPRYRSASPCAAPKKTPQRGVAGYAVNPLSIALLVQPRMNKRS